MENYNTRVARSRNIKGNNTIELSVGRLQSSYKSRLKIMLVLCVLDVKHILNRWITLCTYVARLYVYKLHFFVILKMNFLCFFVYIYHHHWAGFEYNQLFLPISRFIRFTIFKLLQLFVAKIIFFIKFVDLTITEDYNCCWYHSKSIIFILWPGLYFC